jgi:hypothetical protein
MGLARANRSDLVVDIEPSGLACGRFYDDLRTRRATSK